MKAGRQLRLFLCLVLVMSLLPVSAFAAVNTPPVAVRDGQGLQGTEQVLPPTLTWAVGNVHAGAAVSVSGGLMAVGAPDWVSPGGAVMGCVYIYERVGGIWTERDIIPDPDGVWDGQFGATVSLESTRIAVAAPHTDGYSGAVYVFEYDGASWIQKDRIVSPEPQPLSFFGKAMDLEGDTLAVGAPWHDFGAFSQAGTVNVFVTADGSDWSCESTLTAPAPENGGEFGDSVDLDAARAIVGAPGEDAGASDAGRAYTYENAGSWTYEGSMQATDPAVLDAFGSSVAIDGDTAAVTVTRDDLPGADNAGSVRVFEWDGDAWLPEQTLVSFDPVVNSQFGRSIALGDGLLVVGRPALASGVDGGSLEIFVDAGDSWEWLSQVGPTSAMIGDGYGFSLDVSGSTLAVGVRNRDAGPLPDVGGAYVYEGLPGMYVVTEDTTLTVPAVGGVLANDMDADGHALEAVVATAPTGGTLSLAPDGSFTYAPDPSTSGLDVFTYKAFDGFDYSENATVLVLIQPVNDAPDGATDVYSTDEDTTLTVPAPGVLDNDYDFEADPMSAEYVGGSVHGTLDMSPDGSFTYGPDPGWNGTDYFWYRAFDGTDYSEPTTVAIEVASVADVPVAAADSYDTMADTTLTVGAAGGVLANDSDGDGEALTAELVSDVSNGSLSLAADGSFVYEPDTGWSGSDFFAYRAYDGVAYSDPATVTLDVSAINEAPDATDDAYAATEDTTLTVSVAGVLANDSDVDGDTLSAVHLGGPAHGTLALQADGSFTYEPDPDWNGTDSFIYRAFDGTDYSESATVTIDVAAVNDPPTGAADAYSMDEDGTLIQLAATGVLGNDGDIDSASIGAVLWADVSNGSLSLAADGSFTYQPDPDWNGTDSFTYRAYDGVAYSALTVVTLDVGAVNDAPDAADDGYATTEDTTLTVAAAGVLANDSDVDGDALSATELGGPAHGTLALAADGSFTYRPDPDWNGTDAFTYRAYDGTEYSGQATVTIDVAAFNDAPDAADDAFAATEDTTLTTSAAAGVLANDSDVEGTALTAVLGEDAANGAVSLAADGSFTYEPDADWNGTDSFTYRAFDGVAYSATATVEIVVDPVDDAPRASVDTAATAEDSALSVPAPGVLANDAEVDGQLLSADLVTGASHGTLMFGAPGGYTYTPDEDYNGSDSFTYRAYDGGLYSETVTVLITVTAVNDAPVATGEAYAVEERDTLTVPAPGLLSNDTDVEGTSLTAQLLTDVSNGTLSLAEDGSFTYEPDRGFVGRDAFRYAASDGTDVSEGATVTIDVSEMQVVEADEAAGTDRYATAVEVSEQAFPNGADAVVIATGRQWPDAVGGTALAGAMKAPILLVDKDAMPAAVRAEIDRLGAESAVVLGSEAAVGDGVFEALETQLGEDGVERIGGDDRYETARMVAERTVSLLGPAYDGTAFLTVGGNFPDALAASPLASSRCWPVYLTRSDAIDPATTAAMDSAGVDRVLILGGEVVVGDSVEESVSDAGFDVERLAGDDRYGTAVEIAEFAVAEAGLDWHGLGVATGQTFPDALTGGVLLGRAGTVLLLTHPERLPGATAACIGRHAEAIDHVRYIGSTEAVSADVRASIADLL